MNDRSMQQRGAVVGALALTLLGAAAVAPMDAGGDGKPSFWSLASIERGLTGLRDDLAHRWWELAGPMRGDGLHCYAAAEPELEALAMHAGYPGEALPGRLFSNP